MTDLKLPHDHGQALEHKMDQMPEPEDFQVVSELFKLLSDSSRIRIFWVLCHCEECVINISAMVGMSSPAVSHHLRLLRDSGLVISRREGKEVYYTAADNERGQLLHKMFEAMLQISCPNL